MKAFKHACIFVIAVCGFSKSFGQQLYLTAYNEKRVSDSKVNVLIQDANGFVWLGTDNGIEYFDGIKYEPYFEDRVKGKVTSFLQGKGTGIYCGGEFGIVRLPDVSNTAPPDFIVNTSKVATDSTITVPQELFLDAQNQLWISESDALVLYKENKINRYIFTSETGQQLPVKLAEDDFGALWAFSPALGFYKFNNDAGQFENVLFNQIDHERNFIAYIGENKFWLVADGIYEVQTLESGELRLSKKVWDESREVTAIISNEGGRKYLGTRDTGIIAAVLNDDEGWNFEEVYHKRSQQLVEPLPFRKVDFMYQSDARELWVLTDGEIYFLKSSFFQNLGSLPYYNTYAIFESTDEAIYVVMGEVYKLKDNYGTPNWKSIDLFKGGAVSGISAVNNGVWLSDTKGNLEFIVNEKLERTVALADRGGSIFNIYKDLNDNLWICQAPREKPIFGLVKVKPDFELQFYEEENGLSGRILVVKNAPDGTLYCAGIGTKTYLYQYDSATDQFKNISLPLNFVQNGNFEIHDMVVDNNGVIWMASTHGLLRQDATGVHRESLGPYTDSEIRSIALGANGAKWMASNTQGLLYFHKGEYVHFGRESGLPSELMGHRGLLVDSKGYLWVGTTQGTVRSWTGNPVPSVTMKPVVQMLEINGTPITLSEHNPDFKYGSDFKITFHSPSFPSGEVEYQTRVVGIDEKWSQPSGEKEFSLTNIPNGFYTFQARARRMGGYAWSEPISYTFEVNVVWYKAIWAYGVYLLLGGAFIWRVVSVNSNELKKKNEVLEHQIKSRTEKILAQQSELQKQNMTIWEERRKLEEAQEIIEKKNEELLKVNTQLEEKVKERTRDLHTAYEELDATNKELDQFIYHSSHDLRGPICTLLGLCYLAQMEKQKDDIKLYLKKIETSGREMNEMLLKMMEAHEIKTVKTIQPRYLDIAKEINNVIDKMPEKQHLNDMSVEIVVESGAGIHTDAFLFAILIRCLVINAIRYRDPEKPIQKLNITAQLDQHSRANISVKDNGIGISNAVSVKVFDMFFRGTERSKGPGLGLYEAKIIAEKLKGKISFTSTVGKGTEFLVVLADLK